MDLGVYPVSGGLGSLFIGFFPEEFLGRRANTDIGMFSTICADPRGGFTLTPRSTPAGILPRSL